MTAFPKNLEMTGVSHPTILRDGYPMEELLSTEIAPDLYENIVGPYQNVSEYLDIHYDLLSEDFMFPIRKGIKDLKQKYCPDSDTLNGVRVFKEVSLTSVTNERSRGKYKYVNCVLRFGNDSDELRNFVFGSLLVFTRNDFKDIYLGRVIADRDRNGTIVIELKIPLTECIERFCCSVFMIIEADVFYYMYQHVLKVLNCFNEQNFPMKKYIVYGKRGTEVNAPSYLALPLPLYKIFKLRPTHIFDMHDWPSCENLDMDESQYSALKTALTKELAVIQGAPGTGKTYFGVRLIKVLLDNINVWNMDRLTPILVVCQSNQALDHFMQNLLEYTDKIVRIGDQCHCEPVKPYSLKELVCRESVKLSSKNGRLKCLLYDIDKTRFDIHQDSVNGQNQISLDKQKKTLESLENELHHIWDTLPNKFANSLQILKSAYVVGMTSTAAAARREYVEQLKSPIVLIEEAGEVLESHVVVSMTEHCQHLILLGDRKQLKPLVNTSHIARDYNLDMSLFERLLQNGVVEGNLLTTQYRMRQEISSLLKPHIYEVLHDDPSTLERPNIRGLSKNVFFLDHQHPEIKADDNQGCWNPHEVDMMIYLACYLVFCRDYSPTDIAIIAMYAEQKKQLIKARDQVSGLLDLEIASVDAFQGREKEIILLSLVRSNPGGHIGFLAEETRICVALSRARSGLYIMGSMNCLKSNSVWREVHRKLIDDKQIGPAWPVVCEHHQFCVKIAELQDWQGLNFCPHCPMSAKLAWTDGQNSPNLFRNDFGRTRADGQHIPDVSRNDPRSAKSEWTDGQTAPHRFRNDWTRRAENLYSRSVAVNVPENVVYEKFECDDRRDSRNHVDREQERDCASFCFSEVLALLFFGIFISVSGFLFYKFSRGCG